MADPLAMIFWRHFQGASS